jgi:hypothetical protein
MLTRISLRYIRDTFAASVMAGLVPAIHVLLSRTKDVDARNRCGHDELNECVV